ncbi:glycogen debranching enzyme N-terminal domain-containing protein, partial [uncultured Duncaniella sp.]
MSYLKFDKNLMINLEQSLPKEMLRTNQAGAYHCTTIVDCNTRKQHGLLVVPIPEMGNSWHVMLSSLDETVYQHGAPFNLGLHRYSGGVMSPNGHKYIREFDCESVPRTTYRVGGVILTKEKIFISNENRILIRYTLVEAHSATTLRFRPVLAFREANELCIANDTLNTEIPEIDNGVSACLYKGYPRL